MRVSHFPGVVAGGLPSEFLPGSSAADVGQRVSQFRREAGWTQTQLADAAGLNRFTVSKIERGLVHIRPGTRERLAKAFGVDPTQLVPQVRVDQLVRALQLAHSMVVTQADRVPNPDPSTATADLMLFVMAADAFVEQAHCVARVVDGLERELADCDTTTMYLRNLRNTVVHGVGRMPELSPSPGVVADPDGEVSLAEVVEVTSQLVATVAAKAGLAGDISVSPQCASREHAYCRGRLCPARGCWCSEVRRPLSLACRCECHESTHSPLGMRSTHHA